MQQLSLILIICIAAVTAKLQSAFADDDFLKVPISEIHTSKKKKTRQAARTSERRVAPNPKSSEIEVTRNTPEKPVKSKTPNKTGKKSRTPAAIQGSILKKLAPIYGKVLSKPNPIKGEEMTLKKALDRSVQNNKNLQQTRLSLKQSELTYNDAFDTMFMPSVNMVYTANSTLTVGHIPGPLYDQNGKTQATHGYPSQSLAFQLGSYTLFNFWKDYDTYEQARLDWVRTKETYLEQVRANNFQVTVAYFKYKTELEKLDANQRSINISEAFAEVVKSQIGIEKATQNDLSSAQVDLLNAKNTYNQQQSAVIGQQWALNQLLGDPIGTPYNVREKLKFVPLTLTPEEALKLYLENAPNMKDKRRDIKKAELALDLAQKNRLPLPKVTFSGVNLTYNNSFNTYKTTLATDQSTADLNVSAQISLTIPLLGPGGFFGSRTVGHSEIALDLANLAFVNTAYSDEVTLHQAIQQTIQQEQSITINTEAFQKSLSILESISGTIASGTINRLEQRDAINNARNFELQLEDLKVQHLQNKLNIAQLIGVDRLPGDSF